MYHFTGQGPGAAQYQLPGSGAGHYQQYGAPLPSTAAPQAGVWTQAPSAAHYPSYASTTAYQPASQGYPYQNYNFKHSASHTPYLMPAKNHPTTVPSYSSGLPGQLHQQPAAYHPGTSINISQSQLPQPTQLFPHQSTSTVISANQESCYNCGDYGHWAQNCPEARRAVPAGDITRRSKRQKTGVAPQRPKQQASLQRGWTHPLPSRHQGQIHTAPPAPQTASPLSQSSWQQGQPPQTTSHQTLTFPPSTVGLPSPASPDSSALSVPPSSTAIATQGADHRARSSQELQTPAVMRTHEEQAVTPSEMRSNQHGGSTRSQPSPTSPHASTNEEVNRLQELFELDVVKNQPVIISTPATEVGQPLPSSMLEADTVCALPPLKHLSAGITISKYLSDVASDSYLKPVNERNDYWTMKDDPIFVRFTDTDDYVPLDELNTHHIPEIPAIASAEVAGSDIERSFHSRYGNKAGELSHDQDGLKIEEQRLSREQEERLVALGVTGSAKPVDNLAITRSGPPQDTMTVSGHQQQWQVTSSRGSTCGIIHVPTWGHKYTASPYQVQAPQVSNSFASSPKFSAWPGSCATGEMSQQNAQSLHDDRKRSMDKNIQPIDGPPKRQKHKQTNGTGNAAYARRW